MHFLNEVRSELLTNIKGKQQVCETVSTLTHPVVGGIYKPLESIENEMNSQFGWLDFFNVFEHKKTE